MRLAQAVATTRVCRGKCQRELPLTEEYFRPTGPSKRVPDAEPGWRGTCRRCNHDRENDRNRALRATAREEKAAAPKARWKPRVVGEGGPEGGFTEHPLDGYKWFGFSDIHGRNVDREAFGAALALSSWYRPQRIIVLGDIADFEGLSRFDKPAETAFQMGEDIEAAEWCLGQIRHFHPNAEIEALSGNHDMRWYRYLWKHPAISSALKSRGVDLPGILGLGNHGIKWVENGFLRANAKFMWKHGNAVRQRSAASAMAELDKNGISGASGHTHRLGLHYRTTKAGISVWCESGCLCNLEPDYAEGQTMDWQHGASLGAVSTKSNSFTVHPVPIIKGRAKILGMDISA